MKIENLECLILNTSEKVKQNGEHYVSVGIACINDGSSFTVNSTDMELLKLEPENEDIIIEYVDFCLLNNTEKIKYETDMHHILPKSYFPEFKSDEKNLTCLTYRNHFLAHKLLALAFPQKSKIVFAFNAMKNKIQPFRKKEDLNNTITEEEYKKIPRNDKIFLVYNSSDELVFEGNSLETLDFLQNIDPSIKNCGKIYQAASYEDHQRLQQPKAIRGWRIRIK